MGSISLVLKGLAFWSREATLLNGKGAGTLYPELSTLYSVLAGILRVFNTGLMISFAFDGKNECMCLTSLIALWLCLK